MSWLPASIKRIGSKTTEKRWRHLVSDCRFGVSPVNYPDPDIVFPHYKSMGAFCCHGNQRFVAICPKTLCSLSPTQVMLHIKFDQDWPTGFRDIQVWKCGWQTDDGSLVYYKLTLWAFGSGELKTKPTKNLVTYNNTCTSLMTVSIDKLQIYSVNPYLLWQWTFPSLSNKRAHFQFKGCCLVYCFIFYLFFFLQKFL